MTPFEARQNGSLGHDGTHQIIGFAVNFGQIRPSGRKSCHFTEATTGTAGTDCRGNNRISHAVAALVVCRGLR